MSGTAIQQHGEDGMDTLSTETIPVFFVPGVMGSRIDCGDGRTWDPDCGMSRMLRWVPLLNAGKQQNRRCLSVNTTVATVLTELDIEAFREIEGNNALVNLAGFEGDHTMFGLSAAARYYETKRKWASVAWSSYGPILRQLETTLNHDPSSVHYPVYACGYDWRQSNAVSGAALAEFIATTLANHGARATSCIVVTHSMGGLVLRGALLHDASLRKKIRGVVHTVQPSNGSVTCYRRFISGARAPLEGSAIADSVLNKILGPTGQEYAYNLSGLPGPLELLPNHRYHEFHDEGPWIGGLDSSKHLGDVYNIYRQARWPGIAGTVAAAEAELGTRSERDGKVVQHEFHKHLANAESFHKGLSDTFHDVTYVFYSTGVTTDESVGFNNLFGSIRAEGDRPGDQWFVDGDDVHDVWNEVTYSQRPWGDGTVAGSSGRCPALKSAHSPTPQPIERPLKHADVFKDNDFRRSVIASVLEIAQRKSAT